MKVGILLIAIFIIFLSGLAFASDVYVYQYAQIQSYTNSSITYNLTISVINNQTSTLNLTIDLDDDFYTGTYNITNLEKRRINTTTFSKQFTRVTYPSSEETIYVSPAVASGDANGTSNSLSLIKPWDPETQESYNTPSIQTLNFSFYGLGGTETYRSNSTLYDVENNINSWSFISGASAITFSNTTLYLNLGTPFFPINENITVTDTHDFEDNWTVNLDLTKSGYYQYGSPTVTSQLQAYNTTFNNIASDSVNVSWSHATPSGGTLISGGSGTLTNLLGSINHESIWQGDWITESQGSLTPYSTEVLIRTAYHSENTTAYYNISVTNTEPNVNFTDLFYNSTEPSGWVNTTPSDVYFDVDAGETNSTVVNFTIESAYEDSYAPTYQVSQEENVKNVYTAFIVVTENETAKNLPIRYRIPKARLDDWDSKLSSPAPYAQVNGSSTNVSILGEIATGYIDVLVGTEHSSSSLEEGSYTYEIVYYTPKPTGAGGGGGGAPPPPEEVPIPTVIPIKFEAAPMQFIVQSIPNDKEVINLTIANFDINEISVTIKFIGDNPELGKILDEKTLWFVEPQGYEYIPIEVLLPERVGLKRSFIIQITTKMGELTTIKEIKVNIEAIMGKAFNVKCDRDEECLSGSCTEGKCTAPPIVRKPWWWFILEAIKVAYNYTFGLVLGAI